MKRLILLFTIICAFSITSLAADPVYKLFTWDGSGELHKLTDAKKTFKSTIDFFGRSYISFPQGIEIAAGSKLLIVKTDGINPTYYKASGDQAKNTWTDLKTSNGGDIIFTETFTCYSILIGSDDGSKLSVFFCADEIVPTLYTWAEGAFNDLTDKKFKPVGDLLLYKYEMPEGVEVADKNAFLITAPSIVGEFSPNMLYKAMANTESANSWEKLSFEDLGLYHDIKLTPGKKYYKLLFGFDSRTIYASTIPLKGIKPVAPKFLFDLEAQVTSVELTLPTEIASVNPAFITKAIVTHTVNGVADADPIEPDVTTIVDGKISFVVKNFDPTKENTYSVKYDYVDYLGSTETLATDESEITTIRVFPSAIKVEQDIKHDKAKGNNIFIGAKIQWKAATNINETSPEYILSYATELGGAKMLIENTAPTEENGTYTQYVYGIPSGSSIEVEAKYGEQLSVVSTETPKFTYDITKITLAPTGLEATDLIRYGKSEESKGDGTYAATITWNAPQTEMPVTGYTVKLGDANAIPVKLKTLSDDWQFTGVNKLPLENVSWEGENHVATIKYSVAANYNIGSNVQAEIIEADYSRKDEITKHTSEANVIDILFNISTPTGVEDAISDVVAVYPNPTTGTLVIKNTTPIEKISIFNLAGSCVKEIGGSSDNSATIDIEELSQGTYFVKVNNTVTKVIKK